MRIQPLDHLRQGIHVHRIPKTIARKRALAFPHDDAIALPGDALNQRHVRREARHSSFAQCGTFEGMSGQCKSPEKIKPLGGLRTRDAYSPNSRFMECPVECPAIYVDDPSVTHVGYEERKLRLNLLLSRKICEGVSRPGSTEFQNQPRLREFSSVGAANAAVEIDRPT